jgi:hypothetical protein
MLHATNPAGKLYPATDQSAAHRLKLGRRLDADRGRLGALKRHVTSNGHRLIDPAGLECRDDQEATDQALIIARQIAMDVPVAPVASGNVTSQV